ncbi:MarR family transcriptional regulator [Cytobacillus sp. Sa5YUA1]|uniref:MarR family transcriptional regulator n=1 Tax=Cytobacillus stercorigallinarum TaxID=2762240 RepID=A0ABR8QSH9_9BACI|nr:MarR family transcriptional regulator [Cytobacillus stercorigallinarum]MBD7938443.1 MarR family transcriptional regulator [Cytobacillus stercorigallinarum]
MKATEINKYWTDIYFYLRYQNQNEDKISHQGVRILQLLDKCEHIGIKEVARNLDVSHNTASEHVKRLINKSWIHKERSTVDERMVILRLTEQGRQVLKRNANLDEGKLEHILASLTTEEQQLIDKALHLLSERAKNATNS